MLIQRVETLDLEAGVARSRLCDLRIVAGRIQAIGDIEPEADEPLLQGAGGLLLPGLQDHHLHFRSLAAAEHSLECRSPEMASVANLVQLMRDHDPSGDWLRVTGYHESLAGYLDRRWLDLHGPARPVRIQHRSGRLWILNSAALARLGELTDEPLPEDGRLFDRDRLLHRLPGRELPVRVLSERLARYGVTAFNDMTPDNLGEAADWFHTQQQQGRLLQRVHLSGHPRLRISPATDASRLARGATKLHLHEDCLPEFNSLCGLVRESHEQSRPVAFHAVTEVVLVYVLAALREAGVLAGDRIEHASVAPPALIRSLAETGVTVVTQPNFVAERGASYLRDLPETEHGYLYPCASLQRAGVNLAFGSDAPFGSCDPWFSMRSAVHRRTLTGEVLGAQERLTPEDALRGHLGSLSAPGDRAGLRVGDNADLVLLNAPWKAVREDLTAERVQVTLIGGEPAYQRSQDRVAG